MTIAELRFPHSPLRTPSAAIAGALAKQQESTLVILNLGVLAALALFHLGFVSLIGSPSGTLLAAVAGRFLMQLGELAWLQSARRPPSPAALVRYSTLSIWTNVAFAGLVSTTVSHEDSHYSVLMVIPVVSAAFRFSLAGALSVVGVSTALTFVQVWNYFRLRPPAQPTEYFEAATTALTFLVVSVIAWVLGTYLSNDRRRLAESLEELGRTRDRLIAQEKLAAVGRLSAAIAHEIRNPVGMIAGSLELATSNDLEPATRDEMFRIASTEAARLERLTSEFLTYARAKAPEPQTTDLAFVTGYVASLARARAVERSITVTLAVPELAEAEIDAFQIQQALLNLALNAVEAAGDGGAVRLGAERRDRDRLCLYVEDDGLAIPPGALAHVFEPFFTTKPHGTGLGLAIARSIARAHGGELELARNEPGRVRFELLIPAIASAGAVAEPGDGTNSDRR